MPKNCNLLFRSVRNSMSWPTLDITSQVPIIPNDDLGPLDMSQELPDFTI